MKNGNCCWEILLKVSLGILLVLSFLQFKVKFGWDPIKELEEISRNTNNSDSIPIKVESIKLQDSMRVDVNESKCIEVVIEPENASNKSLEWHSSNNNVAIVKDGIIEGIAAGNCKVFALTMDGSEITSTISVQVSSAIHDPDTYIDESSDNGATDIELIPNKPIDNKPTDIEHVKDEPADNESTNNELARNKPIDNKPIDNEPTVHTLSLPYGTWIGGTKRNKPDGEGIIEFNGTVLVTTNIYAHSGYVLRNAWYVNGKPFSGILFDSDGKEIKRIFSDFKLIPYHGSD